MEPTTTPGPQHQTDRAPETVIDRAARNERAFTLLIESTTD